MYFVKIYLYVKGEILDSFKYQPRIPLQNTSNSNSTTWCWDKYFEELLILSCVDLQTLKLGECKRTSAG